MLDILIVSENAERSAQVEQLISNGVVSARVHTVCETALDDPAKFKHPHVVDVVIAVYDRPQVGDFSALEQLLDHIPQAVGICLSSMPLTNDDIVLAMRVGVRYAQAWPLNQEELMQELHSIDKKKRLQTRGEGRVLTFLSSQGGNGATFIATQVAHICAMVLDKKVLVVDADRQYADAQLFLTPDLQTTTLMDIAEHADRLDTALFEAGITHLNHNLDLLPGAGDPVKAAQIQPEQLTSILRFARTRYDAIVLDVGHHMDAVVMTLLDQSTDIFSVMRQNLPDLYAAKRLVDILQELGYSTEKMQTLVNCFDTASKLSVELLRDSLPGKKFHMLPRDEKVVRRVSEQGAPLREISPRCQLARALERFVLQQFDATQPTTGGRWWPMFRGGSNHSSARHQVQLT